MHKEQSGRTKIHHTKDIQRTRLIQIQKPRGHKEDWAAFPRSILVQKPQQTIPKVLILERRGRNRKEKRRAHGIERGRLCSGAGKEPRERERVREFLTH